MGKVKRNTNGIVRGMKELNSNSRPQRKSELTPSFGKPEPTISHFISSSAPEVKQVAVASNYSGLTFSPTSSYANLRPKKISIDLFRFRPGEHDPSTHTKDGLFKGFPETTQHAQNNIGSDSSKTSVPGVPSKIFSMDASRCKPGDYDPNTYTGDGYFKGFPEGAQYRIGLNAWFRAKNMFVDLVGSSSRPGECDPQTRTEDDLEGQFKSVRAGAHEVGASYYAFHYCNLCKIYFKGSKEKFDHLKQEHSPLLCDVEPMLLESNCYNYIRFPLAIQEVEANTDPTIQSELENSGNHQVVPQPTSEDEKSVKEMNSDSEIGKDEDLQEDEEENKDLKIVYHSEGNEKLGEEENKALYMTFNPETADDDLDQEMEGNENLEQMSSNLDPGSVEFGEEGKITDQQLTLTSTGGNEDLGEEEGKTLAITCNSEGGNKHPEEEEHENLEMTTLNSGEGNEDLEEEMGGESEEPELTEAEFAELEAINLHQIERRWEAALSSSSSFSSTSGTSGSSYVSCESESLETMNIVVQNSSTPEQYFYYLAPLENESQFENTDDDLTGTETNEELLTSSLDAKMVMESFVNYSDDYVEFDYAEEGPFEEDQHQTVIISTNNDLPVQQSSDASVQQRSDVSIQQRSDVSIQQQSDVPIQQRQPSDVYVPRLDNANDDSDSDCVIIDFIDEVQGSAEPPDEVPEQRYKNRIEQDEAHTEHSNSHEESGEEYHRSRNEGTERSILDKISKEDQNQSQEYDDSDSFGAGDQSLFYLYQKFGPGPGPTFKDLLPKRQPSQSTQQNLPNGNHDRPSKLEEHANILDNEIQVEHYEEVNTSEASDESSDEDDSDTHVDSSSSGTDDLGDDVEMESETQSRSQSDKSDEDMAEIGAIETKQEAVTQLDTTLEEPIPNLMQRHRRFLRRHRDGDDDNVESGSQIDGAEAKSTENGGEKDSPTPSTNPAKNAKLELSACVICCTAIPPDELDQHVACHTMRCHTCGDDSIPINEPYAEHGAGHVGPGLTCEVEDCGYEAGSQRDLWQHANTEHFKVRPWICVKCGNSFATRCMLKLHDKTYHSA